MLPGVLIKMSAGEKAQEHTWVAGETPATSLLCPVLQV